MRKIAYFVIVTAVAASMFGCKDSGSPADQVRDICSQARTMLAQASDCLASSTVDGDQNQPAEKALALLAKAEGIAKQALSVDGASEIAKAPAYSLLAELKAISGRTMASIARSGDLKLRSELPVLKTTNRMLAYLQADMSFLKELASARNADTDTDISELAKNIQASTKAQSQLVNDNIAKLQKAMADYKAEAADLDVMAEKTRQLAVSDRHKMLRTVGQQSLELDATASQHEAKYAQMLAAIAKLNDNIFETNQQIAIAKDTAAALEHTDKSAAACIARLVNRESSLETEIQNLNEAIAKTKAKANELSAKTAESFEAISQQFIKATAALSDASAKLKSALRSIKDKATQASRLKSENTNSAMKDLLSNMSARNAGSDLTIRQAELALSTAELQRELLDNSARISQLLATSGSNSELLADRDSIAANAAENYQSAIEYFEKAASMAKSETKWRLDTSRARALWGSYMLTRYAGKTDSQLLMQAEQLIQEVLSENAENTDLYPAKHVQQLIMLEKAVASGQFVAG